MDNVSYLQTLYDAFSRGDMPTVLGAMSAQIKWYEAESNPYRPGGEPWVGPDAVLNELFVKLGTEWDGFAVHPKTFHRAGDSVIVEARYSGTYKATGKSMDTQVCHVWDVKDGKITRFQQYVDTAKLQNVMGTSQLGSRIETPIGFSGDGVPASVRPRTDYGRSLAAEPQLE